MKFVRFTKHFEVRLDYRRADHPLEIEDVARMLIAAAQQPGCLLVECEYNYVLLCATRTRSIEAIVQDYQRQKGLRKRVEAGANIHHRERQVS